MYNNTIYKCSLYTYNTIKKISCITVQNQLNLRNVGKMLWSKRRENFLFHFTVAIYNIVFNK